MEGSKVSRIHLPHATEMPVPTREFSQRLRRPLREQMDTQTPVHQLVATLQRKRWFLLAMVIAGGVLAALSGLARPPLYEATTQVLVDAPSRAAPAGGLISAQDMLDSSIDDHITMLSSQSHLRSVVAALRKMDAAEAAKQPGAGPGNSPPDPARVEPKSRSVLDSLLAKLWPRSTPAEPDAAELKVLREGLRIGQELRSRVISVGFTDPDPARAALVANTFVQVYIGDLAAKSQASDKQELDSIVVGLPAIRDSLAEATDRLERYRLSHGAVDQGAADNAAKETAELTQQISMSKADLAAMESRLQRIEDLRKQGAPVTSLVEAIGTPELAELAARQANAPADKDLSKAIDSEVEQDLARMAAEVNIYRAQVRALEDRKNVLDAVVTDTAGRLSGLRALEPQVSILTQRYNDLLARQQDLKRRIASPSPGVAVLSAAWPPTNATTLPPIFLVPPGMILFGLIGGVLVLVRQRFDRTVRGEVEAEAALRVPCLGLIPQAPTTHAKRLQQLVLGQQESRYSRAVTSLLVAAAPNQLRVRSPHIMLITSSVPEDGGTELAWSLALAATRLGGRVLLVDLEPKGAQLTLEFLHQFSGPKASHSFADYVGNRCALEDAVTGMPEVGIDLMTLGPSEDLLTLLSRGNGSEVMEDLHSVYSVVVINGPSGLGRPEARFLTGWADVVLFAVRWAKTQRHVARGVLELLQGDDSVSVPVGSVLTRVNLKKHARYRLGDSADLLREKI
ncbi:MAG: exopolysaccharide biosynthesis protein [Mesorhizobium sp.]|uniref:GumC family protein n=1 Tax=Mesorhizobium sp. TaxID=1871066 RepID=UPI00121F931F|nr:exopolysaccharide transport family protein [Mesorhizobium sp.]TIO52799.1 MAG: exopolysaccharide biosynthesis protein [Mesorhizobium sp.]TIO59513.1 MAG: exopolysaccharide biosynthesis protein [Mesorhizobium sp.]TJV62950.1 MAG: exopolysaccharide biosynthesis protein [Mesorhizobium sp.]